MSTYQIRTGKSIAQAFEEFHEKNPHVYTLFKKYVRDAINAGRTRVSAKTGTQELKGKELRSVVPEQLCMEILQRLVQTQEKAA